MLFFRPVSLIQLEALWDGCGNSAGWLSPMMFRELLKAKVVYTGFSNLQQHILGNWCKQPVNWLQFQLKMSAMIM